MLQLLSARFETTTLRNHITHPHCEVIKAQKNQNPEAGQTSMARDGSVFRYDLDYLREQFRGFSDSTSVTIQPLWPRANNEGVPEHYATDTPSIPLSDEEIALDASSEGTLSPGGPRYDYMMSSEAEDE
ncbi:hypothetical protein Tco_0506193 [Tanacetum coccineum]